MKTKSILLFLLMVSLFGTISFTFAQSASNTSERLEKLLSKMKISYQFSSNLNMYKIEYCRLSTCATIYIYHTVIDKQDILKFYTYIGTLKNENLRFYQDMNDATSKLGLGSLILYGDDKELLWFYVMLGMDADNINFYCDYVLNQQSNLIAVLQENLKE